MYRETRKTSLKKAQEARGCKGGLSYELLQYKRGAADRGYSWELTDEEASSIMTRDCYYCGTPPAMPTMAISLNKVEARNGIDRVDSSLGYVDSNCVSCCAICNRAKHAMPLSDFLAWVSRIAQHQGFTTFNPPPTQEDNTMKWAVQ